MSKAIGWTGVLFGVHLSADVHIFLKIDFRRRGSIGREESRHKCSLKVSSQRVDGISYTDRVHRQYKRLLLGAWPHALHPDDEVHVSDVTRPFEHRLHFVPLCFRARFLRETDEMSSFSLPGVSLY